MSMSDAGPHAALAAALGSALGARRWRCATAESCTGGLVAGAITDIAGSSAWFDRGFVTYSNEAKTAMLGVPAATLAEHGAVSEPTARAMAEGALAPRRRRRRGRGHRHRGARRGGAGQAGRHRVLRLGHAGGRAACRDAAPARRPRSRALASVALALEGLVALASAGGSSARPGPG